MHRLAEYGIAAHWVYKDGGSAERALERSRLQKMLLEQQEVDVSEEEDTTFTDHIFVLTPKGDVLELPEGSTPLDFAFQVHTDIGLACRSAKVNGGVVSLDHELENGDIVEIIKGGRPCATTRWLQILRMSSGKNKLRKFLSERKGRGLLRDSTSVTGAEPVQSLSKGGARKVKDLSPERRRSQRLQGKDVLIEIDDGIPMPIRYAKCCMPEKDKGGAIVGVVTRRGEVRVHRKKCGMLRHVNPERTVGVRWQATSH